MIRLHVLKPISLLAAAGAPMGRGEGVIGGAIKAAATGALAMRRRPNGRSSMSDMLTRSLVVTYCSSCISSVISKLSESERSARPR